MTSNIGFKSNNIGFKNNNNVKNELINTFNSSLLGRIDNTIIFNKLTKQDINKIINNKLLNIKEKYKDILININSNIIDEITEECHYNQFGARKIDKIIKNKLENIIIDNIIENNKEINIDSLFSK